MSAVNIFSFSDLLSAFYQCWTFGWFHMCSYSGIHSYCEFMSTTAIPCPGDNISQHPSPSSSPHILSVSSLMLPELWWKWVNRIVPFRAEHSQSLTLVTWSSYESLYGFNGPFPWLLMTFNNIWCTHCLCLYLHCEVSTHVFHQFLLACLSSLLLSHRYHL